MIFGTNLGAAGGGPIKTIQVTLVRMGVPLRPTGVLDQATRRRGADRRRVEVREARGARRDVGQRGALLNAGDVGRITRLLPALRGNAGVG
jgi:hypothetical protein